MNDFLFGLLTELQTTKVIRAFSGAKKDYAITQLNRIFSDFPEIVVTDGTSYPDFSELLNSIGPEYSKTLKKIN